MDDKNYRNLLKLLKAFQNRPHHLAKYLIDRMAFNDFFLKEISDSENLNKLSDGPLPIFKTIDEMNEYYNNILDNSIKNNKKSPEKILEDLNIKLEECLRLEKYEDAIRIRDYIAKIGLKK